MPPRSASVDSTECSRREKSAEVTPCPITSTAQNPACEPSRAADPMTSPPESSEGWKSQSTRQPGSRASRAGRLRFARRASSSSSRSTRCCTRSRSLVWRNTYSSPNSVPSAPRSGEALTSTGVSAPPAPTTRQSPRRALRPSASGSDTGSTIRLPVAPSSTVTASAMRPPTSSACGRPSSDSAAGFTKVTSPLGSAISTASLMLAATADAHRPDSSDPRARSWRNSAIWMVACRLRSSKGFST